MPIHITQSSAIESDDDTLSFTISLARQGYFTTTIPVSVKFRNLSLWNSTSYKAIHATYFFAVSHPSYFVVVPPMGSRETHSYNPILALRQYTPIKLTWCLLIILVDGAGVDVDMPFWADAFPRQQHSWIVMPTGRTEWVGHERHSYWTLTETIDCRDSTGISSAPKTHGQAWRHSVQYSIAIGRRGFSTLTRR